MYRTLIGNLALRWREWRERKHVGTWNAWPFRFHNTTLKVNLQHVNPENR